GRHRGPRAVDDEPDGEAARAARLAGLARAAAAAAGAATARVADAPAVAAVLRAAAAAAAVAEGAAGRGREPGPRDHAPLGRPGAAVVGLPVRAGHALGARLPVIARAVRLGAARPARGAAGAGQARGGARVLAVTLAARAAVGDGAVRVALAHAEHPKHLGARARGDDHELGALEIAAPGRPVVAVGAVGAVRARRGDHIDIGEREGTRPGQGHRHRVALAL